ncbi:MAG: hypothetical protein AAES65_00890 [Candidatus Thiodiazotropha sp. (ex. Lucinoma kazani)]
MHVFTPSVDVPDDYATGPRLVVLPTNGAYSRSETKQRIHHCRKQILRNRGDQPRQKQNRLIFLPSELTTMSSAVSRNRARIFLAWQSIVADIERRHLTRT